MMCHVGLHYVYLLKDMIMKRSYMYFPNDKRALFTKEGKQDLPKDSEHTPALQPTS